MGQFIDAADTIRQVMNSGTVLLVHHTGKDKSTVRGSSALEAAMDTVYATEGDPLNLRMRRTKRKDGPMDDVHQLRLREVADSAVLESLDPSVRETVAENTRSSRGWTALVTTFGDRTFTKSEAVTVLTETADIPKSTAYRVITDLSAIEAVRDISTTRTPKFVVDRAKGTKAGLPNISGPSITAGDGWFDGLTG